MNNYPCKLNILEPLNNNSLKWEGICTLIYIKKHTESEKAFKISHIMFLANWSINKMRFPKVFKRTIFDIQESHIIHNLIFTAVYLLLMNSLWIWNFVGGCADSQAVSLISPQGNQHPSPSNQTWLGVNYSVSLICYIEALIYVYLYLYTPAKLSSSNGDLIRVISLYMTCIAMWQLHANNCLMPIYFMWKNLKIFNVSDENIM